MNIHHNQKSIQQLLMEKWRDSTGKIVKPKKQFYPGVYIISRTKKYNIFKLGQAHGWGGLFNRIIGQYKICMPLKEKEFFLRYLCISHREKEGKLHYSEVMEREFLTTIGNQVEDSYSKEYIFAPDIVELEKRLMIVLKSHKKYYDICIKFTINGFKIWDEKKGFHTPLQTFAFVKC